MEHIYDQLELLAMEQCAPPFYKPDGLDLKLKNNTGLFSFFDKPVTNTVPGRIMTAKQAYEVITGRKYETVTRILRSIADKTTARNYKARNFDYCTYSGTFDTRADKGLIKHSGFIILDFDHIANIKKLDESLIVNKYFETVMTFISPSGDGLKWLVNIDINEHTHIEWFQCISCYVKKCFDLTVDRSGKDISRCCFLPYDPQAYINPKYLL